MTITTLEALEAVPVGEAVQVTSRQLGTKVWTRVDEGLKSVEHDAVLELSLFSGAVQRGWVTPATQPDPVPGQLYEPVGYSDHRYQYVVVEVPEAGRAKCLYFRRGQFYDVRTRSFTALHEDYRLVPEAEHPDWVRVAYTLGTRWVGESAAAAALRTTLREVRDEVAAQERRVQVPLTGTVTGELHGEVNGTMTGTVTLTLP